MFGSWPDIGHDRSNEYLRKIETAREGGSLPMRDHAAFMARDVLTKEYSWAIPTEEAIGEICTQCLTWRLRSLISIGAGTGFWEHLIQVEMGKREPHFGVEAWDSHPPRGGENSYHHTREWHPILEGDVGAPSSALCASLARDDSALFLCWPPYAKPVAADALRLFGGKLVVYLGEGEGGCTADDAFHRMLRQGWQRISEADLPQWPGIHDWLSIWLRR